MSVRNGTKREVLASFKHFAPRTEDTSDAINRFFESLDTPKSLAAYLLFNSEEHDQLLALDVDPLHYLQDEADRFHLDYCAVKFLSKFNKLSTTFNKKDQALQKFQLMELRCAETNRRFQSISDKQHQKYSHLLLRMVNKIDRLLGSFEIEEFFDNPAWGPGVSTLLRGCDTSAARKFQFETGITGALYAHIHPIISDVYPLWMTGEQPRLRGSDSMLSIEGGNRVTTVPKNSKTDRVIAIEPGINLWFQKSIGSMIRTRLKRDGINLDSQVRNQQLCLKASLTGSLATVDFSSASDLISRSLVETLLPQRWFTVLDLCRSRCGVMQGSKFEWNKFSSMGNGFTFELESLIFYAAAVACCEACDSSCAEVSVFGDDVVLPIDAYPLFAEFCDYLGFIINKEKSYASSLFRESCGSHYFAGIDVKPIFLKESLTNAFCVYKLANSIRRLSHRRCLNLGCDKRFLSVWRATLQRLPKPLRHLRVPEGFGDGGVLSNFDEACPSRARFGYEGFLVPNLAERSRVIYNDQHGYLLSKLSTPVRPVADKSGRPLNRVEIGPIPERQNTVALRGRTSVSYQSGMLVPSWYNLGAWI